ncbi:tetratricopeptide repeat protein [Calditrichota bacterium LG25]
MSFKRLNRRTFYLGLFTVFFALAFAYGQEIDLKKQLYEISINNVKILYTNGDKAGAFKRLVKLEERFPDDALVKYMLAILYYWYREDPQQAKRYFREAQKINPKYDRPPGNLTRDDLLEIFAPKGKSGANLKIVIAEIEKSIQRNKWEEAEVSFINGKQYIDQASPKIQAIYYLQGLRIYDKKKEEILSLYYFNKVKETFLSGKYKRQFEPFKEKYDPRWKRFKKLYADVGTVSNAISNYLNEKNLDELLIFLDLCTVIHEKNREVKFFLELKRLEAFLNIPDLKRAEKLYQSLSLQKINIQNAGYLATLDRLHSELLILKAEQIIRWEKARADSLMLVGLYDEGMAIYKSILERQKKGRLAARFGNELIYLALAKIHKDIGKYNNARKYLDRLKKTVQLQQRVNSLRDSIARAELFEKTWQEKMHEAKKAWANANFDKVINTVRPLLQSPYLRYGMKFDTYNLLADAFAKKGYFYWAKHLKMVAMRYPLIAKSLTLDDVKEQLQPLYQQQRFYLMPSVTRFKYPLKIRYYRNVEFLIKQHLYDDYVAGKKQVRFSAKFMSSSSLPISSGAIYSIEFEEKGINKNLLVGAGILTMNGLMMLSR